jgi:hypothetical protein
LDVGFRAVWQVVHGEIPPVFVCGT